MSKRDIEDGECSDDEVQEIPKVKKRKIEEKEEFAEFFIDKEIDAEGVEVVVEKEEERNGTVRKKTMLGDVIVEEKKRPNRRTCFNCGGDHMITACKEPKDFTRIRLSKLAHQKQQQNQSRYCVDSKEESGDEFRPGRLSAKLREALNIGPDDIPEWVYRMRKMGVTKGYPPGYLKKAMKYDTSGSLLKFHTTSDNIPNVVDETARRAQPVLDQTKVHFYMGLNKTYRALRDRESYRCPPFDVFCEFLQKEANEIHEREEDARLNALKRRMDEKKEEEEADDDCIIIDKNPTNGEKNGDAENKEEDSIVVEEKEEEQEDDEADQSAMGDSISIHIGTPVLSRRSIEGKWERETLPDLDKFAVGIVPFEANEEMIGEKGIFKRIMSKIKKIATGSSAGEGSSK